MLNEVNSASVYFNEHWKKYQESMINNTIYHREMFSALSTLINEQYTNRPFTLADLGCGDSSAIASVLSHCPIQKYIGIDAAEDVLKLAARSMSLINCEKEFICSEMLAAISYLPSSIDIIFTSYAVHHLSLLQKKNFVQACKDKLIKNGFLIMVDGTLKKNQTREEWLAALKLRMKETCPNITEKELVIRMEHPLADDYPESIETFAAMAKQQGWEAFQVIVETKIAAFMLFIK